jgi:flagellar biogenesis protein FliO
VLDSDGHAGCNAPVPAGPFLGRLLLLAPLAGGEPPVPAGYGALLLRVVLALLGVCALAYVVLRFLGARLHGSAGGPGLLRLVARLHLEPRRAVYVIEAAGRFLLLGSGDGGAPTLLCELDAAAVRRLAVTPAPKASFLVGLRGAAAAPPPIIGPPASPPDAARADGEGERR